MTLYFLISLSPAGAMPFSAPPLITAVPFHLAMTHCLHTPNQWAFSPPTQRCLLFYTDWCCDSWANTLEPRPYKDSSLICIHVTLNGSCQWFTEATWIQRHFELTTPPRFCCYTIFIQKALQPKCARFYVLNLQSPFKKARDVCQENVPKV